MLIHVVIWVAMLAATDVAKLPDAVSIFESERPIQLADAAYYADGGTIGVVLTNAVGDTLMGGFDGRMQMGDHAYPWHCFAGAQYPSELGASLLPLWGPAERSLVTLLNSVVGASMAQEDRLQILSARRFTRFSERIDETTWHLVRAIDRRRETLLAIDKGWATSEADALRYFRWESPPTITSLAIVDSTARLLVTVRISDTKSYPIEFPSDLDSRGDSTIGVSGYRYSAPIGTLEDRKIVTLVMIALRNDQEGISVPLINPLRSVLIARSQNTIRDDDAR